MKNLISKSALLVVALATSGGMAGPAKEKISDGVVKIGVLTDMSGVYSTLGGKGTQVAVEMAVHDFGGTVLGKPIQVIGADHQNKADIASAKAREWFDTQNVRMINDLINSGVALSVMTVAKEKDRIAIINGSGSSRITGDACTPTSIHYAYDTFALANGTGN